MHLFVTGTVRNIPDPYKHGRIAKVDWETGQILRGHSRVFPAAFCTRNGNPRGGTRGWRGIERGRADGELVIANNDSLVYFDYDLNIRDVQTFPAFGNIHSLSYIDGNLCVVSTLNDTYCILKNGKWEVHEPLADRTIYSMVKRWLIIRTRDRKPYVSTRDYREEWYEDTLHLNSVVKSEKGELLALFNSMNLLVRLAPNPAVLWGSITDKLEVPRAWPGLQCPHDLVFETPRTLLINSSARQELYRFDLDAHSLRLVWDYKEEQLEWNRGLALDRENNSVFIGMGSGIVVEVDLSTHKEKKRVQVFERDGEDPCSVFNIFPVKG